MTDKTKRMIEREDILISLYNSADMQNIAYLLVEELNSSTTNMLEVLSRYDIAIYLHQAPNTIVSNISIFRKTIKDMLGLKHEALKYYEQKKFLEVIADYREHTQAKKTKPKINTFYEIEKSIKILQKNKINGDRKFHLFFVIGLITGRRLSEILSTLSIIKKRKKIVYTGLLKKNDKEIEVDAYLLYDKLSIDDLIAYLNELQSMYSHLINVANQSSNFSRGLTKITNSRIVNARQLRDLYTYEMMERSVSWESSESAQEYKRKILGHAELKDSTKRYGRYEK